MGDNGGYTLFRVGEGDDFREVTKVGNALHLSLLGLWGIRELD